MWAYLSESIGIKIFLGISFIIAAMIVAMRMRENRLKEKDISEDSRANTIFESTITIKNMFIGMLIGFVFMFILAQIISICKTNSISFYSEIAGLGFGFVGALIGSLCGVIKWKRTT